MMMLPTKETAVSEVRECKKMSSMWTHFLVCIYMFSVFIRTHMYDMSKCFTKICWWIITTCGSYICYAVFTVSKKFAGIVYTHCIQIIRNGYVHFLFKQLTQMRFWNMNGVWNIVKVLNCLIILVYVFEN